MTNSLTRLIESHLTGISIDDSQHLIRIYLRGVDHQNSIITISGVDRFLVNELRETNIVESISFWSSLSSDTDYCDSLIFLITGKQGNDFDRTFISVLDKAKESIRAGKKILFLIEPVYGAQVIALAEKISIETAGIEIAF